MDEWRPYTGICLGWLRKMMINLNQKLSQETQWPTRIQTRKIPYTILAYSHHTNSGSIQLEDHKFTIDGHMHLTNLNGLRKLIWETYFQEVVPAMVGKQQQCHVTCFGTVVRNPKLYCDENTKRDLRQNSTLMLTDISTVWQLILLLQYCDYRTKGFLASYFSNCENGGSAPTPIASFWSFNSRLIQAWTGGENVRVFRNYCSVGRFQSIRSKQSLPALVIKLIWTRWMIY